VRELAVVLASERLHQGDALEAEQIREGVLVDDGGGVRRVVAACGGRGVQ
jgi:hypothetical protein